MTNHQSRQAGMSAGQRLLDTIRHTNARIEGRPAVRHEIELSDDAPRPSIASNVIELFPESENQ